MNGNTNVETGTTLNNMGSNNVGNSNDTMTTTDTMPGTRRNRFVSKKTLGQGLFDLALLSSNTNQLVHLLGDRVSPSRPGLRTATIVLLISSIILQVIVGGVLIALVTRGRSQRNPNENQNDPNSQSQSQSQQRRPMSRNLNNAATILIFFITIINVIIPSLHPNHEDRNSSDFDSRNGGHDRYIG